MGSHEEALTTSEKLAYGPRAAGSLVKEVNYYVGVDCRRFDFSRGPVERGW